MHKILKRVCAAALGMVMAFSIPIIAANQLTEQIPVRAFFEGMDATVEWYCPPQRITITLNKQEITLYIGSDNAYINGNPINLGQEIELRYSTSFMLYDDAANILAAVRAEVFGVHGAIAFRHLEFIEENLGYRLPFSARERETAEWIVQELIYMGHDAANIRLQEFSISEAPMWYNFLTDLNLIGDYEPVYYITDWLGLASAFNIRDMSAFEGMEFLNYSQNVILTVPGASEKRIIVGAHYDGVNNVGISDNASGIVTLLESAQRILHLEHYYTITYIFFGAEEVGLIGAEYYVASLTEEERENIVLMVNVDVIFDGSMLTYGVGYHDFETWHEGCNEVSQIIESIADSLNIAFGLELVRQRGGVYVSSDQLVFLFEGFNILVFYAVNRFVPPGGWVEIPEPDIELTIYSTRAMLENIDDLAMIASIGEQISHLELATIFGFTEITVDLVLEEIAYIEIMIQETEDDEFVEYLLWIMEMLGVVYVEFLEHPRINDLAEVLEYVFGIESSTVMFSSADWGYVLHTDNDNLAFITYNWPGLIERALETYQLLLERVLTLPSGSLS